MTKIDYVVGFMFSHDRSYVALIRKQKPAWQRGKLNGIGGKVEPGEKRHDAMAREFFEETGYYTTAEQWDYFCEMYGNEKAGNGISGTFHVDFFFTVGDLAQPKTTTDEQVVIFKTRDVHPLRRDMIENLPWVIALALDVLDDGRPEFISCRYP